MSFDLLERGILGSQTLPGLFSSWERAEALLFQTSVQEFSCSFFPAWSAIIFSLFSPPTLLKYRVLQQQWETCWIIPLHFKNALELLGIVACDVGLFSFTWHCSVFYEPELEPDIIINSVSFGLLQYWLFCFTLTVGETLHFSSEIETHFVQYLERKGKIHFFYCRSTDGVFLVCVKVRCY